MHNKTSWIQLFIAAAILVAIYGCGKANENAPLLSTTGKHTADWLVKHRSEYRQDPSRCMECHGKDLKGGVTKVDCFNQGGLATCHSTGHGPRSIVHTLPFTDPLLHGVEARKDLIICQDCHGTIGGGGSNPRFTVTIGSLTTGCEASACHTANMAHPKPWANHRLAGNQANACALCHGATFTGGTGPSCQNCHTRLVAGQLPSPGTCVSCHGNPPNGTVAPNRLGSHSAHLALPELQNNCGVCHSGGGYGTSVHQNFASHSSATVNVVGTYNAKSGAASYSKSGKTCDNIKCHGGLRTPAWGGVIAVSKDCLTCHSAGAGQYNSYVSGKHQFHVGLGLFCTDCHDMTNQVNPSHFSNLSSATLNQVPAITIRSYLNYNRSNSAPTCSTPVAAPAGTQFTSCHSDVRKWQ